GLELAADLDVLQVTGHHGIDTRRAASARHGQAAAARRDLVEQHADHLVAYTLAVELGLGSERLDREPVEDRVEAPAPRDRAVVVLWHEPLERFVDQLVPAVQARLDRVA